MVVPLVRFPGNQFIAELLVTRKSFFNDDESSVSGLDVLYLNLLALELLVILEEAAQDEEAMIREVARFEILAEFGIVGGDGDDLVVAGARIDHGHHADGACLDEGEWLDRFLAKDEDIERIVIFRVSLGDETVVRGIEDRGVNDAVDAEQAGGLVQFVFHIGAEGNFDQGLKIAR